MTGDSRGVVLFESSCVGTCFGGIFALLPVTVKALRPCGQIVYNNRLGIIPGPQPGLCTLNSRLTSTFGFIDTKFRLAFSAPVYWRVEGSLLDLTTVQPVAFFTWNAQTFAARMARRGLVFLMAALRPFLYAAHRVFATRVVHAVLRGVSRDRLDLLGDEYFQYKLKPHLKPDGLASLKRLQAEGADIVLVSQGLDHVMRPLAEFLGVKWLVANRLDFRDRVATGRLLSPVFGPAVYLLASQGRGQTANAKRIAFLWELNLPDVSVLRTGIVPAERSIPGRRASGRLLRQSQACSALFRPACNGWKNM